MICAEILSEELEQYLKHLEKNKRTSQKQMKQILLRIDDVFRNIEREMNETLDH